MEKDENFRDMLCLYGNVELGAVAVKKGKIVEGSFTPYVSEEEVIELIERMDVDKRIHIRSRGGDLALAARHYGIDPGAYVSEIDLFSYVQSKGNNSIETMSAETRRLIDEKGLTGIIFEKDPVALIRKMGPGAVVDGLPYTHSGEVREKIRRKRHSKRTRSKR